MREISRVARHFFIIEEKPRGLVQATGALTIFGCAVIVGGRKRQHRRIATISPNFATSQPKTREYIKTGKTKAQKGVHRRREAR